MDTLEKSKPEPPAGLVAKAEARRMFISGSFTVDQISEATGIPANTINTWAHREGWRDDRRELEDQLMAKARDEVMSLVDGRRLPTFKRHLDASQLIEERIITKLSEKNAKGEPAYIAPKDLAIYAKALKDATDVSGRIVGVSDSNPLGVQNRSQLVVVGLRARKIKTVQATVVEPDPF